MLTAIFLIALAAFCTMLYLVGWRRVLGPWLSDRRRDRREKEEARLARMRERLRNKKFMVVIRTQKGGKDDFESILIQTLISFGATVQAVADETAKALCKGVYKGIPEGVLVVTGIISERFSYTPRYILFDIDYRIADHNGSFLAAGHLSQSAVDWLGRKLVEHIAGITPKD